MPTTTSRGLVKMASDLEPADLFGTNTRLADSTNDALEEIDIEWTPYTPTIAGITGTATGLWIRSGKLRTVKIEIEATGAATDLITATKPSSSIAGDELAVGTFLATDTSAGARYTGVVIDGGGSAAVFFTAGNNVFMTGVGPSPWTWASGDKITATFSYEEA